MRHVHVDDVKEIVPPVEGHADERMFPRHNRNRRARPTFGFLRISNGELALLADLFARINLDDSVPCAGDSRVAEEVAKV